MSNIETKHGILKLIKIKADGQTMVTYHRDTSWGTKLTFWNCAGGRHLVPYLEFIADVEPLLFDQGATSITYADQKADQSNG